MTIKVFFYLTLTKIWRQWNRTCGNIKKKLFKENARFLSILDKKCNIFRHLSCYYVKLNWTCWNKFPNENTKNVYKLHKLIQILPSKHCNNDIKTWVFFLVIFYVENCIYCLTIYICVVDIAWKTSIRLSYRIKSITFFNPLIYNIETRFLLIFISGCFVNESNSISFT